MPTANTIYEIIRVVIAYIYSFSETFKKVSLYFNRPPSPSCFLTFKVDKVSGVIPFDSMTQMQLYLERNEEPFDTKVFKYKSINGKYLLQDIDYYVGASSHTSPSTTLSDIISAELYVSNRSPIDVYDFLLSTFHPDTLITRIPFELVVYLFNKSSIEVADQSSTINDKNCLVYRTTNLNTVEVN